MKLKVHVAADQLTQWWDGHICDKSEKVRTFTEGTRYYLAMSFLQSEGFLVQEVELGSDIEKWELPVAAPSKWRVLNQFRYVERNEISISKEELKIYVSAMMVDWTQQNFKKCLLEIDGVLELFVDGSVGCAQWTSEGLLEFRVMPLGAERFGLRASDTYQSPIGRRFLQSIDLNGRNLNNSRGMMN